MKKIALKTVLTVYPDLDALPAVIGGLMKGAVEARDKAYAPYSGFKVGAAIALENGAIVYGNNQENAAFPSGLCAERVAVYAAGATYPDAVIKSVAITACAPDTDFTEAAAPCGACRQALAEYESRQGTPIEIYFMGEGSEIYHVSSVEQLLPLIFTGKSLTGK